MRKPEIISNSECDAYFWKDKFRRLDRELAIRDDTIVVLTDEIRSARRLAELLFQHIDDLEGATCGCHYKEMIRQNVTHPCKQGLPWEVEK